MCGIIGYVGSRECKPLLLQGLERLEYRGYDSAGIALMDDEQGGAEGVRAVGNLSKLRDAAGLSAPQSFVSDIAILTIATALTGLLLRPKPATTPSGAGHE